MKNIMRIDEDDIRLILAEYFDVPEEQVEETLTDTEFYFDVITREGVKLK